MRYLLSTTIWYTYELYFLFLSTFSSFPLWGKIRFFWGKISASWRALFLIFYLSDMTYTQLSHKLESMRIYLFAADYDEKSCETAKKAVKKQPTIFFTQKWLHCLWFISTLLPTTLCCHNEQTWMCACVDSLSNFIHESAATDGKN